MSANSPSSTTKSRLLKMLIVGIPALFAGFLVCSQLSSLEPLMSYILNRPRVTLDAEGVTTVCGQLQFPADDPFCANPDQQNTITLRDALRRVYPVEDTNYAALTPLLSVYPSTTSPQCTPKSSSRWDVSALDNCPALDNCLDRGIDLTCTFYINSLGTTSLRLFFDRNSGNITRYDVAIQSETETDAD
ncbi:MAG: hypothetical protein RLP44_32430 [Aggregatilineales bacterium]